MPEPPPAPTTRAKDVFAWYFYVAGACFMAALGLNILDTPWLAAMVFFMAALNLGIATARAREHQVQFSILGILLTTLGIAVAATVCRWLMFDVVTFVAIVSATAIFVSLGVQVVEYIRDARR